MDDRDLVTRLLEIGVDAHQSENKYASPSNDPQLKNLSVATIANWLEELGRFRLIEDVNPSFSPSGPGFVFSVTKDAIKLFSDGEKFEDWLNEMFPKLPEYDLFISYATGDAPIANELCHELEVNGLKCFLAEKDIQVSTEWQDAIRSALIGSKRIFVLLTPRSINRPWVLMETGAAWALNKELIPALLHVSTRDLPDPIQRYQARVIETVGQRQSLVKELANL
jgi:hypothetical protein